MEATIIEHEQRSDLSSRSHYFSQGERDDMRQQKKKKEKASISIRHRQKGATTTTKRKEFFTLLYSSDVHFLSNKPLCHLPCIEWVILSAEATVSAVRTRGDGPQTIVYQRKRKVENLVSDRFFLGSGLQIKIKNNNTSSE